MIDNLFNQAQDGTINGIRPQQKLFDIKKVRRTGMVILKPIRNDKFKDSSLQFRSFRGYEEGGNKTEKVWFGIPIELFPNGTYKFSVQTIRNQKMFNLENEQDALAWHIWKHHFWVKGSPNATADIRFEVYDEEIEADEVINKTKLAISASMIITRMDEADLVNYARLIGLDPVLNKPRIIQSKLLQMAMKTPSVIIDYSRDKEFSNAKISLLRGVAYGIITKDPLKGFMFRGSSMLGNTEEQATRSLLKDLQTLSIIEAESKGFEDKAFEAKNARTNPITGPAKPIDEFKKEAEVDITGDTVIEEDELDF